MIHRLTFPSGKLLAIDDAWRHFKIGRDNLYELYIEGHIEDPDPRTHDDYIGDIEWVLRVESGIRQNKWIELNVEIWDGDPKNALNVAFHEELKLLEVALSSFFTELPLERQNKMTIAKAQENAINFLKVAQRYVDLQTFA